MATWIGDFKNQAVGGASLVPQASAAAASFSAAGNSVDLLNGEGPLMAIYSTGLVTGTPDSQSVTFKLQYSLDNSSWSDYTTVGGDTANALTAVTTASTDTLALYWHLPVGARYWKVVATVALVNGSSPKIGVTAYLYRQKKQLGGTGTQNVVTTLT